MPRVALHKRKLREKRENARAQAREKARVDQISELLNSYIPPIHIRIDLAPAYRALARSIKAMGNVHLFARELQKVAKARFAKAAEAKAGL